MDREKLREEITLWKRCINNEKGAWEDFSERYHRLIWSLIHKKIPDRHPKFDKEEIFQEAFLRLTRKLDQWKRRVRLTTYVGCITQSAIIDYMRKHRRSISVGERGTRSIYEVNKDGEKKIDLVDPMADPKFIEGKIYVDKILSLSTPQDALLIKLRFLEGHSPEQVANMLSISLNAFYARESRVRSKLREQVLAGENL